MLDCDLFPSLAHLLGRGRGEMPRTQNRSWVLGVQRDSRGRQRILLLDPGLELEHRGSG